MMAIARYWDLSVLYVYAFSWHCMLPVRSIRVNFTAGHDLIRLAQRQRVGDLPQLVHHVLPRDNRIRRYISID
uniref:Uncharacterized protein n=1 Tax=Rhizophora mucronata TaxID=61149 RepID=A0A2P2JJH7_RHIMU